MELETLNKLYLELSQFATAKTQKEIDFEKRIEELESSIFEMRELVYDLADQQAMPDGFWKNKLSEIWEKLWPCPF